MKRHAFHPEAEEEYTQAARYFTDQGGPELGGRFFDEIEKVIEQIRNTPGRYRAFDPPARRNLARDFPFAVVYLDEPDCIWILAVMHLKREPGYWRHRLT